MAIYATHKVSGSNGIDDINNRLNQKSDWQDDIIEMNDILSVTAMYGGLVPVMQYSNEETAQMVSYQPITLDADKKIITYSKPLNIYSRLSKRGERFIGTLSPHCAIDYIFKNDAGDVTKDIHFEAGNKSARYTIENTIDNDDIRFLIDQEGILEVNSKVINSKTDTELKHVLFPGEKPNKPSAEIKITLPTALNAPTEASPQEIMRLRYYSHVGYAFDRGILAGKAVFSWLNHKMEEFENKYKDHTHGSSTDKPN